MASKDMGGMRGSGPGSKGFGPYGNGGAKPSKRVIKAQAAQNKAAQTYKTANPTRSEAAKKGYQTRIANEKQADRDRIKAAQKSATKTTVRRSVPIGVAAAGAAYGAGRVTGRRDSDVVAAKKAAAARQAAKSYKLKSSSMSYKLKSSSMVRKKTK
jgi:hypothetical protein